MRRILNAEWAGLLAAIVLGAIVLAVVSPNFLSEFNFYVLLRSVCVSILVAFAQMVTLAVGQMNLSVGALGGMVAILFGGMMEVFGVPLWLAVPIALCDRRAGRARQRPPGGAHRHQRLYRHAGDGLGLHRRQPRPHQIRAVLQHAACAAGLRQRPDRGVSVPADRPARRLPAARPLSVPPAGRTAGFWLSAATARLRRSRAFRPPTPLSSRTASPGSWPRSGRCSPSRSSARRSR